MAFSFLSDWWLHRRLLTALSEHLETDADVIMEINKSRDATTPRSAIHIAWIQDYKLDKTYECLPQDIIYTLGHGPAIGFPPHPNYRGSLLPGVDPILLTRPSPEHQTIDLSLVGYMPEPILWKMEKPIDGVRECVIDVVRRHFKPLTGSLDQQRLVVELQSALGRIPNIWNELDKNYCGAIIHEVARAYDRWTVAKLMMQTSANVRFFGSYWDLWDVPASPLVVDPSELHDIYQRSRINVHNNIFGFALHSRVLEAMAVGGFVMAHSSPWIGYDGQITESFIPDIHYGEYTAENFVERARWWLDNPSARNLAAMEAKKIIKSKHLWEHRANQIMNAL